MILARYAALDGPRYGLVEGDRIRELRYSPFEGPVEPWGPPQALADVRLLAPSVPSKIVLASTNYGEVLRMFGKPRPEEPIIFVKPSTAAIGPDEPIRIPAGTSRVTHEPELAVVIGRPCARVAPEDVAGHVLGYTCMNDLSARDIQDREVHMTRAKGFDTFGPFGPVIVTELDTARLGIRSYVNGEKVLETTTDDMIFGVAELVSFVSWCMTLLPGDVVSTGASGVGPVAAGDRIDIEVDGVGRLSNPVVDRSRW